MRVNRRLAAREACPPPIGRDTELAHDRAPWDLADRYERAAVAAFHKGAIAEAERLAEHAVDRRGGPGRRPWRWPWPWPVAA